MRMLAMLLAAASAASAVGPEFVRIPAGSFTMGCEPESGCPEQQPPQRITFERPFLMHRTEVTTSDFGDFVRATGYKTEAEAAGQKWTWSHPRAFKPHGRLPVVYVTAKDAAAYCSWIGARLPTEPEWTYAFRANETVQGRLWWNTDPSYVWFRENAKARPHPVATRRANAWGLHDMEGSAWEWTRAVLPGKSPYAIRGGSWVTCRVIEGAPTEKPGEYPPFSRCPSVGDHIRDDVGFRCVRDE